MAERQQALAQIILRDPAVASLSSIIGIDGTNTTVNSGRMLINLKPLAERGLSANDVVHRLQPELQAVANIHLYLQPVQDLTVEDRVSRTQYQTASRTPMRRARSPGAEAGRGAQRAAGAARRAATSRTAACKRC
jgi:multidrug efflux pump